MGNLGLGPMQILAARRANQMRLMQMGRAPSPIAATAPRSGPDMGTQIGQGLGAIGNMLGKFGAQRKAEEQQAAEMKAVTGLLNQQRNEALAPGGPTIDAAAQAASVKPTYPPQIANLARAMVEAGQTKEALAMLGRYGMKASDEQGAEKLTLFHPAAPDKTVKVRPGTPADTAYRDAGWGETPSVKPVEEWIDIASPGDRAAAGIAKTDTKMYQRNSVTKNLRVIGGGGTTVNINPADTLKDAAAKSAAALPEPGGIGSLGVPTPDTNPFRGLPPEEAGKLARDLRKKAIDGFTEDREKAAQTEITNSRIQRFVALADGGMETGARYAMPGAARIAATVNADVAEALAIVDELTPQMRQGLPGASSDRDVRMFRGATIGLDKPKEANKNIALAYNIRSRTLHDRLAFREAYFDQNKHLQGADRAWKTYLEANPFSTTRPKSGVTN